MAQAQSTRRRKQRAAARRVQDAGSPAAVKNGQETAEKRAPHGVQDILEQLPAAGLLDEYAQTLQAYQNRAAAGTTSRHSTHPPLHLAGVSIVI